MAIRPTYLPRTGGISAPTWRDITNAFNQSQTAANLFQENMIARRSQDALQGYLRDGVVTPEEIAQGGPGLDVEGLLKVGTDLKAAQDLSASQAAATALTRQQEIEAIRKNDPAYIARQEAMEKAKEDRLTSLANIAKSQHEQTQADRKLYKDAQTAFDTSWKSVLDEAENPNELKSIDQIFDYDNPGSTTRGQLHKPTAFAQMQSQRAARGLPPLTSQQAEQWSQKWDNDLPERKRALRTRFMQDFAQSNPQLARALSDTPDYKGLKEQQAKIDDLIAQAELDRQNKEKAQFENLNKHGSKFMTIEAGNDGTFSYKPSDRARTVTDKAGVSQAISLISANNRLPLDQTANEVHWDWATDTGEMTNAEGIAQVLAAAGNHPGIAEQAVQDMMQIDTRMFGKDQHYVDWDRAKSRAAEIRKTMDDYAAELNQQYLRNR